MREEPIQIAVASWLSCRRGVLWCHVPNGGHRNPRVGASLRRQGVRKGVPDLLVFDRPPNRPEFVGTAIEIKASKSSRVQPEQRQWIEALTERGWFARVCVGYTETIRTLIELGY